MGMAEGEERGTGPGPLKKRANSEKGLKIEHTSEATVIRQNGICLILRGWLRGHQNPDLRPVLETSGGN